MVVLDPEALKPTQCSICESQDIVNPVNERDIDLRCLNCGHEKVHVPTPLEREMNPTGASARTWMPKKNPKPYREF